MKSKAPRLFIHIGEPKAASSSLQEYFRLHASDLKAKGIIYPFTDSGKLRISSGNLTGVNSLPELKEKILDATKNYPNNDLLFSSEFLFRILLDENLRQIKALIQSLGYELHLLWVTRDLIDIAISQYMQSLRSPRPKSPGLDHFLSSALRRIEQRIELIEAIQKSGVAWSFFDLSRTKSIESDVFEKLGVPISSFQKIPIMNRGFTLLEYQLIASLRFLPGPDRLSLSNQLNVSPSKEKLLKISFNTEEIRTFGNACNPLINQFNALVPENAQLPLITEENANGEGVSLQELNELYIDDNRLGIISDWFHTRFIRKPPMKQSIFSKITRYVLNRICIM